MEMESMMAFGASLQSVKLLYSLDMLEYLFPPVEEALQIVGYPK